MNAKTSADFGVFIGRFQPLHLGHEHTIRHALEHVARLIVLVGSAKIIPIVIGYNLCYSGSVPAGAFGGAPLLRGVSCRKPSDLCARLKLASQGMVRLKSLLLSVFVAFAFKKRG